MKHPKQHRPIVGRIFSWVAIVLLSIGAIVAILLAWQLPHNKQQLMRQALVQDACQHIDCTFLEPPAYRTDWEKITLTDTAVYPDAGGYTLRFVIRNQASHPQPLPTLLLDSFAADGSLIAQRQISAQQYRNSSVHNGTSDVIATQASQAFTLNLGGLADGIVRYALRIAKTA